MDRIRRSLSGKQLFLLLTALLIISAFVLSGCSDASDMSAENVKESSVDDVAGGMEVPEKQPENADRESVSSEEEGEAEESKNVLIPTEKMESSDAGTQAPDPGPVLTSDDAEAQTTVAVQEENLRPAVESSEAPVDESLMSVWENSFLLFVPKLSTGVPEDRRCEETFDHVIVGGIGSKRAIEDYIEEVKAKGFTIDADYVDHNGNIDFHAYNSDGWYVTVDYDINTAKADIGCGFFAEKKEKCPEDYFGEEVLAVLPLPESGILTGGKTDGDYPYVLYCELGIEDALAYAKKLRKAGFDKEILEGEADDLCWYNATGPGGYICDMQYADGILMIGCDREEE